MSSIIETSALTHRYGKKNSAARPAVDGISLQIEQGSIFGFIGPNGAGKTTTMRILCTLMSPTAGEAWIGGCSVRTDPRGVRRQIGYMPDFFGVYNEMKVWEYLDFFASCYDVPANKRMGLIDDLLHLVDLGHRRDDSVDSLSRGMKQRLCLARTLTHDPQVLILDEPASGLDPRARIEIRELLRELQAMGKTIFFSSHILLEVAEICTTIGIIEAGQLVAQGSLADIQGQGLTRRVRIGLLDGVEAAHAALSALPNVHGIYAAEVFQNGGRAGADGGGLEILVDFVGDDEVLARLLSTLVAAQVPVIGFHEEKLDLETLFMQRTRGVVS